jgi:DNA-binding NtrC family response regulator
MTRPSHRSKILGYFSAHHWPGNVRELKNAVTRVGITPSAAFPPSAGAAPRPAPLLSSLLLPDGTLRPMREARRLSADALEREYLQLALDRACGNVSRGAQLAGLSRGMFSRLLAKHGLRLRDQET